MEHHLLSLAIATAAVAAAEAAATSQRAPPENILTLHNVDVEDMLAHDEYGAWFRSHLRCSQASFRAICSIFRTILNDYNLDAYNKRHGYEKNVAMLLHFLASGKGYRGTGLALGVSASWASEVIGLVCDENRKTRKQFIKLPRTGAEWREIESGLREMRGLSGVVGAVMALCLLSIDLPTT
ncbi:hypothetical protein GQ600_7390 [Phytophthora cactorum]|nr:hypothetical protein GQ600_7390 [Phytophthora cactorum]